MADNWDDDDWNAAPIPAAGGEAAAPAEDFETLGQARLAAGAPSASQFADEDAEEEQVVQDFKKPSQPKKKVAKAWAKGEAVDEPLDDPVAEKLRQQRLVEESDFKAARELFGGGSGSSKLDAMLPKTVKDFEEYSQLLVNRYIAPHAASKNYRAFVKLLARAITEPLSAEESKEVEQAVAGVRAEKVKAEREAAAAKAKPKKSLNVGKGGGSAGLDDYIYAADDDDDDFM